MVICCDASITGEIEKPKGALQNIKQILTLNLLQQLHRTMRLSLFAVLLYLLPCQAQRDILSSYPKIYEYQPRTDVRDHVRLGFQSDVMHAVH